jgi:hypothetical protein
MTSSKNGLKKSNQTLTLTERFRRKFKAAAGLPPPSDLRTIASLPVHPKSDSEIQSAWIDLLRSLQPESYVTVWQDVFCLNRNGRIVVTLRIRSNNFPVGVRAISVSALTSDGVEIPAVPEAVGLDVESLLEFAIPESSLNEWCDEPHFVLRVYQRLPETPSPSVE